jgi:hypothetical protein
MQSRQDLLMQRAELADQKAAAAIPYDFARQIRNLDRVVADGLGRQYLSDLTMAVGPGRVGLADAKTMATGYLNDLNIKSNSIKNFRDQGMEYINKMAPNLGIDKGRASQILSGYIATNAMDPEKLSDPIAFINDAVKSKPDLFVDNRLGANVFTDMMKKAPRYVQSGSTTVNPTGTEKERLDWRMSQPWFYDFEETVEKKTGLKYDTAKLRVDKDGLIAQDVFDYFYNSGQSDLDFRMQTWIDAGATREISAANLGKQPGDPGYIDERNESAMDMFRRKYLTESIKSMNVGSFNLGVAETPTRKPGSTGGGRGRGASAKAPAQPDYIQQVMSTIETGSAQDVSDILMRMSAGSGSVKVEEVKTHPTNKGFTVYFRTKEGGKEVKRSKDFNPASPNFEAELTGFYQRATGSDTKTERRVMTQPKSTKKPQLTIKRSDIASKARAAGYTEDEYEQLLKQKNVKIID